MKRVKRKKATKTTCEGVCAPYALQIRSQDWELWRTCREFDTLKEAKEAYDALPYKGSYRIAEAYVQVRYKAVRV